MTGIPDGAITAAAQVLRDELADCDDCGSRQMATQLAEAVTAAAAPLIAAQAAAAERQRIRSDHEQHMGPFHVVCCLDKPADLLGGVS